MAAAANLDLRHDALLPRPPGGTGIGALLALLVHLLLLLALTLAVNWRMHASQTISAELWSSVPQAAAPRVETPLAPEPQPAPPTPAAARAPPPAPPAALRQPEPDIALEQEQRRKAVAAKQAEAAKQAAIAHQQAEEAKQAALAKQQAEARAAQARVERQQREQQAREAKAADARLARLREQTLKRMMGEAGQNESRSGTGEAARDAAPSAAYLGRIAKLIRDRSVFAGTVSGNPAAEVEVRTGAGGIILSQRLVKSSGSKEWDEAVKRAIDKVGRLPPDSDGRVPFALTISFRPYDE